ncbi:unnamed protein product [Prorocentrum cordatum]|uniref:EamA domain-containing protein n=1 Tax=Prorocentrum cordatum TaxID=2364126 RepID=A0ABN9WRK0_9DINO|nr:unnamed protein product [Polarella glacialis]
MSEGTRLLSRRAAPEAPAAAEGPEGPAEARGWLPRPAAVAPLLAVLSCVLYCGNGELLQALQALAAELGAGGALANTPRTTALLFAFVIMGYNWAWLSSARLVPAGLTNAVFQTSIAFVYLASTHLFAEPLTLPRMVGVGLSIAGSGLASGLVHLGASPSNTLQAASGTMMGVMLALVAALGVTVYQVLFRQLFGHLKSDWRFLAYFGAWVSVWHVLAILPLVMLASPLGIEKLALPSSSEAWAGTMVSAALASAVNALYLCIVMWGSPMLLPCASALSVPLTVVLDAALHGARPTAVECLGHLMVVVSVVLIMELYGTALVSMGKQWLGAARADDDRSLAVPTKLGAVRAGGSTPPTAV